MKKLPNEIVFAIEQWADELRRYRAIQARNNQLEAIKLVVCDNCRKKLDKRKLDEI